MSTQSGLQSYQRIIFESPDKS